MLYVIKNRFIDSSDRYASALDGVRDNCPPVPDFVWRIISRYRNKGSATAWNHVREFVAITVLQMTPTTPDNTRRLMSRVGTYVCWVWTVTGCNLDNTTVFTASLLARYTAQALEQKSPTFRWDVQRQLATVIRTLTSAAVDTMRRPAVGSSNRSYTPAQVATMYSWANTLSTPKKQRNARAILALCAGAGLTAAELIAVRVEDIQQCDGVTVVQLRGARARRIPVLNNWARTLTLAIDGRTSGELFRGFRHEEYPPRAVQKFLSDNPCPVRPSPARLHHGWVLTQMQNRLPISVLLEICGFANPGALNTYLLHLPTMPTENFFPAISNPTGI